jgi:hypothetical protein
VQAGFNQFQDKVRENMQRGMDKTAATVNTPLLIPEGAAVGGASDKVRSTQVQQMIQCVGDRTGLQSGVTSELQGMYRDAVRVERFKQDPGIINGLKLLFGS